MCLVTSQLALPTPPTPPPHDMMVAVRCALPSTAAAEGRLAMTRSSQREQVREKKCDSSALVVACVAGGWGCTKVRQQQHQVGAHTHSCCRLLLAHRGSRPALAFPR